MNKNSKIKIYLKSNQNSNIKENHITKGLKNYKKNYT